MYFIPRIVSLVLSNYTSFNSFDLLYFTVFFHRFVSKFSNYKKFVAMFFVSSTSYLSIFFLRMHYVSHQKQLLCLCLFIFIWNYDQNKKKHVWQDLSSSFRIFWLAIYWIFHDRLSECLAGLLVFSTFVTTVTMWPNVIWALLMQFTVVHGTKCRIKSSNISQFWWPFRNNQFIYMDASIYDASAAHFKGWDSI